MNGAVTVANIAGAGSCHGFLVDDPPPYVLAHKIPSDKEKDYLEDKINCYRDQIQEHPNDAVAYTNIGEADRRLGDFEAARKAHQKALKLNPDLQEAQIGIALVEQDLNNKVAANNAIQDALAQKKNAIAYFYQGAILHRQNDLEGAKAAWRQAKILDPIVQKFIPNGHLLNLKVNWHLFQRNNDGQKPTAITSNSAGQHQLSS
nr:tetratricopeptide repeat protein [Coleofasciculus sp. FACHB-1120]